MMNPCLIPAFLWICSEDLRLPVRKKSQERMVGWASRPRTKFGIFPLILGIVGLSFKLFDLRLCVLILLLSFYV